MSDNIALLAEIQGAVLRARQMAAETRDAQKTRHVPLPTLSSNALANWTWLPSAYGYQKKPQPCKLGLSGKCSPTKGKLAPCVP